MLKQLAVVLIGLSSPAIAQTVEVETFTGSVSVEAGPDKIAVFDLAAMDTLQALGVAVDGLVSPVYLPYLESAATGTTAVGSLFEPDFEAVNAMQPDLIIAGGRSSEQVPELAKIAPTLDMTIYDDVVGEGLARLEAYGAIFDKADEAAALKAGFEAQLQAAKDAVADKGTALIVMTNGPKVSTYGVGGRFGWLHSALDLPEAVDGVEQSTHGEAVSFEFIRDANPDILLVVDRLAAIGTDGDNAKATLDNALVHETKAWANGNVLYLNPAPIYIAGGGIQSMTQTLKDIESAF
ncbi:siderophore ABC transporter substrate-binding protein [Litoreibacter albidus]|uniref:siderophore ABC transporter substrate-binding protein n=1 Tax=Litoreibacter albidus TaxID=670155 RepID=UPI0037359E4B